LGQIYHDLALVPGKSDYQKLEKTHASGHRLTGRHPQLSLAAEV